MIIVFLGSFTQFSDEQIVNEIEYASRKTVRSIERVFYKEDDIDQRIENIREAFEDSFQTVLLSAAVLNSTPANQTPIIEWATISKIKKFLIIQRNELFNFDRDGEGRPYYSKDYKVSMTPRTAKELKEDMWKLYTMLKLFEAYIVSYKDFCPCYPLIPYVQECVANPKDINLNFVMTKNELKRLRTMI